MSHPASTWVTAARASGNGVRAPSMASSSFSNSGDANTLACGSCAGSARTGTVQPGAVYITGTYQVAVEAVIPLNGEPAQSTDLALDLCDDSR